MNVILPPSAVVESGKIAFGSKSRFGSTWHASQVHIQELESSLIAVLKALTVSAIDLIKRLMQLDHIFSCTGIQRLLHDRLLGTGRSSKSTLQAWIDTQSRIDFDEANRLIKASVSLPMGVCLTVFCLICT